MPEVLLDEWNEFVARHPEAHILQTGAWGELKSGFGWHPVRVVCEGAGAQLLFRRLPLGFTVGYIPKGPVLEDGRSPKGTLWTADDQSPIVNRRWSVVHSLPFWDRLWSEVDDICRRQRAVFLKVEPDTWENPSEAAPAWPGFVRSPRNIQPQRTIVLDLRGGEDDILARMKQKCRYNVRLAEKKGVTVRAWDDLAAFHEMVRVTGGRDGFGVHTLDYYRRAYELFHGAGICELFVAEFEGRPLAALMVFARGKRAWYLFGASTDDERNRMPTYLLQWQAMLWARSHGAEEYDLWGVPDEDEAALESEFEARADGLWGVYRFKRGFGGRLKRALQAQDRIFNPLLYRMYLLRAGSTEAA